MSEHYLNLIPTDPQWRPSRAQETEILRFVTELAPLATKVSIPWWQSCMDRTYKTRFVDLAVVMPCCARPA
jgi:predicted RNA-binding protein